MAGTATCARGSTTLVATGRGAPTARRANAGAEEPAAIPTPSSPQGRAGGADVDRLLVRSAAGDVDAFAALYDATAPLVLSVCVRVVRDRAQAEEVMQEVMVEAWRTAARFDAARGSATTWLATLARRRSVDRVRSSQSSRNREDAVGADLVGGGARTDQPQVDLTGDAVVEADEHAAVHGALRQLSPVQRQALELAFYGGMTHREVADHLDAPLGTVKSRLRDGLRRLREVLEGPDVPERPRGVST